MERACSLSSTQRIVRFGRMSPPLLDGQRRQGICVSKFLGWSGEPVALIKIVEGIIGARVSSVKRVASEKTNFSLERDFLSVSRKKPPLEGSIRSRRQKKI